MFETKIIISPNHANYDANMINENKNIEKIITIKGNVKLNHRHPI